MAAGMVLAAALLAAGCGSDDANNASGATSAVTSDNSKVGVSDSEVTLGIIADQTGPTAATQQPYQHGIEAYFKYANDKGGVNGRKIDVKTWDEKYTPEAALAGIKAFTTQTPVFALIGSLNGGSVQTAAAPIVQRQKLPVVGPQAVQKDVLKGGNPYVFQMQCDYSTQADVAFAHMVKKTGKETPKVAIIALPVPGGAEWTELMKARTEKAGGTVTGAYTIPPTATDADAVAQRVLRDKPDWFTVQGAGSTAVVILKSMAKFGADLPGVGIMSTGAKSVYESVPESIGRNWDSVHCYTPADISVPGTADMVAAASKYGYDKDVQDVNFVTGWVVGMTTAKALEDAGEDLTRGSFIKALEGLDDFETGGLSGPIGFGPNDRQGIGQLRPYHFDYGTDKSVAEGEYADWASFVTNEYSQAG
jgi:ABC-type branched-subunit amino acid transport system substrate-binding protein